MPIDYEAISRENTVLFGTEVSHYGRLLAEQLYSDRTHFLFELLQNAEDAEATRIAFNLHPDRLEVRHNGAPFTADDVRGICGLAKGTKRENLGKIGKFGIGFKSVYGYTGTPEVHSGEEHFRIVDYVHPKAVAPIVGLERDTLFVFHFDRQEPTATAAYAQIRERLMRLDTRTLLFLRRIARLDWQTNRGEAGNLTREIETAGSPRRVIMRDFRGNLRDEQRFLIFARNFKHQPDAPELTVELAFATRSDGQIVPEMSANLVVFFPTQKPLPMRCLLQGPFQTTPARDNVPASAPLNQTIIAQAAILLTNVLKHIRDNGFFTVSFLSTLPIAPIEYNGLFEMFRPLRDALLDAFRNDAFIPASDGGYLRSSEAWLPEKAWLRDLLDSEQLAELLETPVARWVDAAACNSTVEPFFSTQLDVPTLTVSRFVGALSESFLSRQDDEWLKLLYRALGAELTWRQGKDKDAILREIYRIHLIRLENGSHVCFSPQAPVPAAYLPPSGATEFPVVRRCLVAEPTEKAFFLQLGLTEPSLVEELFLHVFPLYRALTSSKPPFVEHRRHAELLLESLPPVGHRDRPRVLQQLRALPFFEASNPTTGAQALLRADEIYIETPKLRDFLHGNPNIWFYADLEGLAPLARELGASSRLKFLRLEQAPSGGDGVDWNIEGLEFFVSNLGGLTTVEALSAGGLLWSLMVEAANELGDRDIQARFEGQARQISLRGRVRYQSQPSSVAKLLREHAWVPGSESLFRPQEISPSELSPHLPRHDGLTKLLALRPDAATQLAQSLGTTVQELDEILRYRAEFLVWLKNKKSRVERNSNASLAAEVPGKVERDQEAWKEQKVGVAEGPRSASDSVALPISPAPDLERRAAKATVAATEAAIKTYQPISVSSRVSIKGIDPKAYLRHHNRNDDGNVVCQLCDRLMPFKLHGYDHFVATQFVSALSAEVEANHLALCPNCAAEYKYACGTSQRERLNALLEFTEITGGEALRIVLDMPVHKSLRFTQRHLVDLREALRVLASDQIAENLSDF